MEKQKENITIYNYPSYYPHISDKVIKCLQNDFPNQLPKTKITEFELGVLVGNQQVIDKLIFEKERNGIITSVMVLPLLRKHRR